MCLVPRHPPCKLARLIVFLVAVSVCLSLALPLNRKFTFRVFFAVVNPRQNLVGNLLDIECPLSRKGADEYRARVWEYLGDLLNAARKSVAGHLDSIVQKCQMGGLAGRSGRYPLKCPSAPSHEYQGRSSYG